MTVRVEPFTGPALGDLLPELARLRIEVFREYPYLYEGDLSYEERYLASFATSRDAVIVAAFDGERLVGAATAAPLVTQLEAFWAPLRRAGVAIDECFYFGESVLLPEFRGRGIGHEFFDERETHARSFEEVRAAVFCAVVRPEDHPSRPEGYRTLDRFWRKRGYEPLPEVIGHLSWPEVGTEPAVEHEMQYWLHRLPRGEVAVIVRIAAAAYPIERLASFDAWRRKIAAWIEGAAAGGAALAVFPEYATMEIAGALGEGIAADLARSLAEVAALAGEIDAHHAELARRTGLHILAGTLPARLPDGSFANRARLFSPRGATGAQEKIVMTRFERESSGIRGGDSLRVFDTTLGAIGIAICYDAEFPLVARRLCLAGAEIILVPSATDTAAGGHRVRTGARARALENQCYTVVSCTAGRAPWSAVLDENRGRTGVYAPPDRGFPDDGTIAEGELDTPGWLFADLDLDRLRAVRAEGDVLPLRHWPDSEAPLTVERRSL